MNLGQLKGPNVLLLSYVDSSRNKISLHSPERVFKKKYSMSVKNICVPNALSEMSMLGKGVEEDLLYDDYSGFIICTNPHLKDIAWWKCRNSVFLREKFERCCPRVETFTHYQNGNH